MLGTKVMNTLEHDQDGQTSQDPQSQTIDEYLYSTPRSELNQEYFDAGTQTTDKEDAGHKLAAASASTSLYKTPKADPKDLPSFPTHGVQDLEASSAKAALLAASQSKSPELWSPGPLPAAGAAASLANSVKSPEVWKPEELPAASAAAVLAKRHKKSPEVWQPGSPSSSASTAAVLAKSHQKSPEVWQPGSPSMPASKAAILSQDSKAPELWKPTNSNNALTAASLANRPPAPASVPERPASSSGSGSSYDINRINRIATTNASNRLSAASPPVSQTQQDKNRSDILRAASLSMAKAKNPPAPAVVSDNKLRDSFYAGLSSSPQRSQTTPKPSKVNRNSTTAASIAATQNKTSSNRQAEPSPDRMARMYPHLEEAARKAAAERLARLQSEHDMYRTSSGLSNFANMQQKQQDISDVERSRKIKADTMKLRQQMEAVDKQKAAQDHLRLLALAERNVKARLEGLENKVAEDQGRVPKHLQAEWDAKAKILSEEQEKKRAVETETKKGKIDMGGGLWYDKEDLDRIARGNVQPILDEINDKAEKERARQEQLRIEREETERTKKLQAERDAETKAEIKKAKAAEKAETKAKRAEEKEAERKHRAEIKAAERERKEQMKAIRQSEKENNERQKEFEKTMAAGSAAVMTDEAVKAKEAHENYNEQMEAVNQVREEQADVREAREAEESPVSSVSPISKEDSEGKKDKKTWFGSISRRLSRKEKGDNNHEDKKNMISNPILIADELDEAVSDPEEEQERSSMRDIAMAGTVSPVSDNEDEYQIVADKRKAVYVPSTSSSSSEDLYTDVFKPLTSATFNPGELAMPEFAAVDNLKEDTSSVSSLDSDSDAEAAPQIAPAAVKPTSTEEAAVEETVPEKDDEVPDVAGEVEGESSSQSREAPQRHHTFGEMLKSAFSGFSKPELDKELEKEKEKQPELKHEEEGAAYVGHEPLPPVGGPAAAEEDDDGNEEFSEATDHFDTDKGITPPGEGVRKDAAEKDFGGGKASRFSENF